MKCDHPLDPAMLEHVKKPFCMRLEWPGPEGKPLAYTMRREDVAHCLMHVEEMRDTPDHVLQADIVRMLRRRKPNHGMIMQALFYLCTHDPVYEQVGGVPTVDFAWVRPDQNWVILLGRQEPGPENVRMIESVS